MQDIPSIEAVIQETYREMVQAMPFDKITVTELCRRANVSRKTFYEHYEDRDDLLKRIMYQDLTRDTESLKPLFANADAQLSAPLLMEQMYQRIYDNRAFYEALVTRGGAQHFTTTAMRCFIELHEKLSQREGGRPSTRRTYGCRFGAGANAAVIVQWIRDGMETTPHELAQWMSGWNMAAAQEGFRV